MSRSMQPYSSAEWKAFRNEVIRLDGGECKQCGRGPSDGVVLNVHHKTYIRGHKPWEYTHDLCETLCKGCHAALHHLIRPKFGWEFFGWEDLGQPTGSCDCCGRAIRYVFIISHADWETTEVGETCCDNLTSTQVASGFMESKRRYADMLKRFVSSKRWHLYPGDIHHITQNKMIIRIGRDAGGYRLFVNGIAGRQVYPSALDAKVAIFEQIASGRLETYLAKRSGRTRRAQSVGTPG